jgi:flagellar hook-associated protein 2
MPTLQSPGVGSGLDVNGLVTQLMAAEKLPGTNRITKEKTSIGTEISALGTFKGALASFGSILEPLKTVEAFSARTADSSDQTIFSAVATSGAAPGNYDVKVTQLAKAQQIASKNFAAPTTVVGSGDLIIGLGTGTFGITVDASNATLAGIRDSINTAPGNLGVRAAIVQAVDGAHLVLTSTKSGAANKITLTTTSTDGLAQLSYNAPGDTSNYTVLAAAQDSSILIAGFEHHSATNVVSDAIDGVTLTLKKESTDPATLSIAANTSAASTRIKNFVSQYNAAYTQIDGLGKYDAAAGKAGPLIGDALQRSVIGELRRGVSSPVTGLTGQITSLAQIGITTTKDGTLQVDDSKLNAALSSNFDDVGKLFGSENGIAARMSAAVTARLDAKADIAVRNQSLNQRTTAVGVAQTTLDAQMAKIEAVYRAQFTALDVALAKMQSTASYLTQQLSNLPKIS